MKSIIRSHFIAALLSLILLLATVAGLFLFVQRIHAREQRVLDARDRLASYEQNKRKLSQEGAELEGIRSRVSVLEKNIITEDTTPTLLSSIETIAKNNGIDFTLTTVSATTATPKAPAKLHIDFSADGSFANLQHFIGDLLNQPYEVQVTRLSLFITDSATGKSAGAWQLLSGIDVISF